MKLESLEVQSVGQPRIQPFQPRPNVQIRAEARKSPRRQVGALDDQPFLETRLKGSGRGQRTPWIQFRRWRWRQQRPVQPLVPRQQVRLGTGRSTWAARGWSPDTTSSFRDRRCVGEHENISAPEVQSSDGRRCSRDVRRSGPSRSSRSCPSSESSLGRSKPGPNPTKSTRTWIYKLINTQVFFTLTFKCFL